MLHIRFNLTGGKVHSDQETTTTDTDVRTTSGRVRFANTNTAQTHQETAGNAEKTLNGK